MFKADNLLALLGVLVVLVGCPGDDDDDTTSTVCDPGATQLCNCVGGADGVQVCEEDGGGWGTCDCGSGDDDDTTGDDDDITSDDDDSGDDDDSAGDDDDTTGDDDDDSAAAQDADGDGWTVGQGDCDDSDPLTYPGAEPYCGGVDADCDGVIDEPQPDVDGDGYTICDDCDDTHPDVYPGAPEDCDGIPDNDCDGGMDPQETDDDGDGATECEGDCNDTDANLNLVDADGDGVDTCSGDCDDEDDTSYPGATEICDDLDNDCNGISDDGLAFDTYFPDVDQDLHGDQDDPGEYTCDPQAGWVTDNTDCDDTDATVYGGAAEQCDAIDNDCDGSPDGSEVDADADGYMVCDGDCDDGGSTVYPGATETCNGVDDDCNGVIPVNEADDDQDGFRVCQGDCDDMDAVSYPGNAEICDGADNDCSGSPLPSEADGDGDGFMVCEGDCDDADASRNPGATEVCEGLDTDCDGSIPSEEYDLDGDGWMGCEECGGIESPWSFPGAVEICDGFDNDCDGTVDEDDALDVTIWYEDGDGDGYGYLYVIEVDCDPVPGYVDDSSDCDDSNPDVHPEAPDICDGINDNDCDGVADESEVDDDADGYSECDGDCDDDDAAVSPDMLDDCDGVDNDCDGVVDGGADADLDGHGICDCDDADPDVFPGMWDRDGDGVDANCDGEDRFGLDSAHVTVEGANGGWVGSVVSAAGDMNNDGFHDIAFSESTSTSYVNLVLGHSQVWPEIVATADASFEAENVGDAAGSAIASAGDVNADGFDDLLIGAPQFSGGGKAYLMLGRDSGWPTQLAVADAAFLAEQFPSTAGGAVAGVGDVNGDGFDDIIVGAEDYLSSYGKVYLIFGRAAGWSPYLADADVHVLGGSGATHTGSSVSGACDVNGDGLDDVLVVADGAPGIHGGIGILFGKMTGWVDIDLDDSDVHLDEGQFLQINCAGDLDGDGYDDIVYGAPSAYGTIYILFGRSTGWPSNYIDADILISSNEYNAYAGYVSHTQGDVDQDGYTDFLIGAPGAAADPYTSNSGETYVVLGRSGGWFTSPESSDYSFVGENVGEAAGTSADIVGDVNGDGLDDVIIGAPSAPSNGAVYLLFSTL